MNFVAMTDQAILSELGQRLQAHRLNTNLTQEEVATQAGISRGAINNLERGHGCTLITLIRVMRVLGRLDQLDLMLPEIGPSPIQLAKLRGRERQRASGRHLKTKRGT